MKHAFKFALRNIRANKLVYGVSVLAIGLGSVCVTLLGMYLRNEYTMDSFHKNIDQIYALANRKTTNGTWRGSFVKYIDFNKAFRVSNYNIKFCTDIYRYKAGLLPVLVDSLSDFPETLVTDSAFFSVFDFTCLAGNQAQIRNEVSSVLFTERYAKKHFGTMDVLGKPVEIIGDIKLHSTVRGIMKNPPSNSSIQFDVLVVYNGTMPVFQPGVSFIRIDKEVDQERMLNDINVLYKSRDFSKDAVAGLIPFKGMYHSGTTSNNWGHILAKTGDQRDLYVVVAVLLILLLVTGVNVYNLQKLSTRRLLKQVSISKLMGARIHQLSSMRWVESMITIAFSWAIGCVLYVLFVSILKQLVGYDVLDSDSLFLLCDLLVIFILVLTSSSIPWLRINRTSVLLGLKGFTKTQHNPFGQKIGLGIQFFLSMVLLFASMVVFFQWSFLTHADLGWNYHSTICTKLVPEVVFKEGASGTEITELFSNKRRQSQFVNDELNAHPSIQSFTQGISPFHEHASSEWKPKGYMDFSNVQNLQVAPDYDKTLHFKLVEGRFFDKTIDWDRGYYKVIINEAAKKYWKIHAIDSCTLLRDGVQEYQIIGVVKDFRHERLALPVKPLVMTYNNDESMPFLIRFTPGKEQEGLAFLQKLHQQILPNEPFTYSLLSEEALALYQKEKRLGYLFALLTLVTLFISLSGLFALTYHDCQRRVKEVGIRKVNGSKVFEIVWLLNKQLMTYLVLAFVLASSVGYIVMQRWLEQFAIQITLSWWLFALTGLIAFVVALLTVSVLSWRAATRNPVESLRYE